MSVCVLAVSFFSGSIVISSMRFGVGIVSMVDTKKGFLKWIGRALRRKQIQFPDENGSVRWTLSNNFFRVGETGLEAESCQDEVKESSAVQTGREDRTSCESH